MNITPHDGDRANPVTVTGKATTPITYDSNCLEEICGSCAMLINGKARMACSALVDNLEQPIKLEPLSKFPLVRDLAGRPLRAVRESEGASKPGFPSMAPTISAPARASSRSSRKQLSAVELHLLHLLHGGLPAVQRRDRLRRRGHHRAGQALQQPPTGSVFKEERLRALAGEGGIQECGYAQNCVEACPKSFRSLRPSPTWAATSSSRKPRTGCAARDASRGGRQRARGVER